MTRYRGGWRLCVTPAGYLGGALWAAICTAVLDYRWGMFCVAASLGLVISMGLWAGGVCYLVLHVGGHLDL